jgi:hypothetical protein
VVSTIVWKRKKSLSPLGIEPQCLSHPSWNPTYNYYARLKLLASTASSFVINIESVYMHACMRAHTHTHTCLHT